MADKKSGEHQKSQVDAILQVGDLPYLKHYLGELGFKNLRNKRAIQLMPNEKD